MADSLSLREEVIKLLVKASDEELDPASLDDSTFLSDDLGLNSLQAVTLVMDIEEKAGITVEDEEIAGLATVGDIFALIESKKRVSS